MKTIRLLFLLSGIAVISIFGQCNKNDMEDPHNHSLLNKTLAQIQAEIAGRWQIKRTHYYICGVAGCDTWDTTYNNNGGDLISFLTNDTVKQVGYTGVPIKLYEKANISKVKVYYGSYNGFPVNVDSAYKYEMANGYYTYFMQEIKNDSLVIFAGRNTHYLSRKP